MFRRRYGYFYFLIFYIYFEILKIQVDNVTTKYRYKPVFIENIPVPVLRLDAIKNDGCPFKGYENIFEQENKQKFKKKRGFCKLCMVEFGDEKMHIKSEVHFGSLSKKREDFIKLEGTCKNIFPNGFEGFIHRLEEYMKKNEDNEE